MYKILKTFHDLDCVFIEQEKSRRNVFVDGKRYFISMPKIIFCIFFSKVGKNFYMEEINGWFFIGKKSYHMPFPNTYADGFICLGNDFVEHNTIEGLISLTMNKFWNSIFKNDENSNYAREKYKGKMLYDFELWEKKTKADKKWVPRSFVEVEDEHKSYIFKTFLQGL